MVPVLRRCRVPPGRSKPGQDFNYPREKPAREPPFRLAFFNRLSY